MYEISLVSDYYAVEEWEMAKQDTGSQPSAKIKSIPVGIEFIKVCGSSSAHTCDTEAE